MLILLKLTCIAIRKICSNHIKTPIRRLQEAYNFSELRWGNLRRDCDWAKSRLDILDFELEITREDMKRAIAKLETTREEMEEAIKELHSVTISRKRKRAKTVYTIKKVYKCRG